MLKHSYRLFLCACLTCRLSQAQEVKQAELGQSVEKHMSSDEPFTLWAQDPERIGIQAGDRLEEREVAGEQVKTVKLANLVPPIRFESGVADIPPSYIQRLRGILDGMQHLRNVRLHLVGHADSEPLSDSLAGVFGDNEGLSRERAGETAEFIQEALGLAPDAISFSWAGDSQPVATNATEAGRAQNRRVEVEVWYDELEKRVGTEEVVVPEEIKRVKVCRTETVCKLRYREGQARRARVKNLIAPLHFAQDGADVPEEFIRQVGDALRNLQNKTDVAVKFIGFTDDIPLTGRDERIYGTHLALSKARAHRVALAVHDALHLPTSAVISEGRGAALPLASNDTERGRALNRRVEVEFWYDDPLQELPDEPQLCPDAPGAELVTKVYDPPWGRIPDLQVENGQIVIPPGNADLPRRAMADVADKTNVRLRFVGYTRNERLDRRTALVYGDDVGLSAARARRAMEAIKAELGLADAQVEHEGRGYVHADDVVNAGFVEADSSYVSVQVAYDELAVLDDYEGIETTPIVRELRPKNPLALNLMRITVDGKPIDDPGRTSADIQRCTDVALEQANMQFGFDTLESQRRLGVTADPPSVPLVASGDSSASIASVRFGTYTNYSSFIARSEIRIFAADQSVHAEPLAVVEVGPGGFAEWQPTDERFAAPVRELKYVLRAYDKSGHFDETAPKPLWLVYEQPRAANPGDHGAIVGGPQPVPEATPEPDPQGRGESSSYGTSEPVVQNIPLGSVGTVKVHGTGIPSEHMVWLAGKPVAVDAQGSFAAEEILPSGMHTVEVAVLDREGSGELFLRDLELKRNDWFYVGLADLNLAMNSTDGPADLLTGENAPLDLDSPADGRMAFYTTGKFTGDWKLTASADTREGPLKDMFSNFMDKSPESLLRRIDPDYYQPTFGDDGTVEEAAPTMGKFFLKASNGESHAMWGNFKVGYADNELAQVDRGLYGANVHYQSLATNGYGEERVVFDSFAAEPGTVGSREEFRATGGSLYFLGQHDLLAGSERVRIEMRDKDSGLVSRVVNLRPGMDYDIDYIQGRIMLSAPVGSTASDGLVVRNGGSSGDEAWLVVQYEHTPGFDEIDAVAAGGQGHVWVNDSVKLGLTASNSDEGNTNSSLYASDLTFRAGARSWLKLQAGQRAGLVPSVLRSTDGGFGFLGTQDLGLNEADADAYRADVSLDFGDLFASSKGRVTFYGQTLDAGYSALGLTALTDTQLFGGTVRMPVTDRMQLAAKTDRRLQTQGLETDAQELDVTYRLNEQWNVNVGARNELRADNSAVVPVTQDEGRRTDAIAQLAFDSASTWRAYSFVQDTLAKTGNREDNGRVGVGGAYRVNERLMVDGEVSHGDLGLAGKLGTTYQNPEGTNMYVNYSLDNERAENGLNSHTGNLIAGARTRLSDSVSVYLEERYQQADSMTGLTHGTGLTLSPTDRWNLGANWDLGTLRDRETGAEMKRRAGGARVTYGLDTVQVSGGLEYRLDEMEQLDGTWADRTTWLFRSTLKFQLSPDWRLTGKLNHSISDSSLGELYDGGYTEAVLGYAYRPIRNDRFNALGKYTYFFNVPSTDQFLSRDITAQFLQKSHIASLDLSYDLTPNWSVGAKYAYRLGQVSLDRDHPEFFANDAHLAILRTDWRFAKDWEGSAEMRMLGLPDLGDQRSGALFGIYRYVGDHLKVGVGYNFTDFSEDLTDLSYDDHGVFFNVVGAW